MNLVPGKLYKAHFGRNNEILPFGCFYGVKHLKNNSNRLLFAFPQDCIVMYLSCESGVGGVGDEWHRVLYKNSIGFISCKLPIEFVEVTNK